LGTNTLSGDIKKAFGSAEGSGASAGKSAGKGFGLGFGGILTAAAGALSVGSFVKGAISAAGDLQQSVGAIDTVFKGSAGQMHDWAKSASTDVGLTENEFNNLGTLIGSQLKNGGTAMDELGPKTKDLITTGADLASMFGGTTQEAVDALSSALKGERDPIERYGVSLNQAKIDAEAAALGFTKVGGSLSAEANQAATVSLIMKQTADAHGNFSRETDTLAHKQQVLNAQWQDGKAAIGSALLPAVTAITGALSSALGPVMTGTLAGIRGLTGGFTAMGAAFQAGGSDITSSGFAGVMERIGLVARQAFDGIGPIIGSIGGFIAPLLPMFSALVPQLFQLYQALSPTSLIFQALLPVLPQIAAAIGGVIAAVLPLVLSLTSQLLPIITQLVSAVLPPLISIFTDIVTAIAPLISIILAVLIPVIQALMPVVVTVFSVIASVITAAMQIVQGVIQVVTGIITGNWSQVWSGILNIFSGIWNTIVAVVGGAIRIVWSSISAGLGLVLGVVGSMLGRIGSFFASTWSNVMGGVGGFIGGLLGFFSGLPGRILSALGNLGSLLLGAGRALIQGFIDGIKGMVGAISDAVGGVLDVAKQFFPHSPAKRGPFSGRGYTSFSGVALASDFAKGISSQEGLVTSAASGLMSAASLNPLGSFSPGSYTASLGTSSGSMSPAFNVYVGNEQLDARTYRVASSAISAADSQSQFSRRGR